MQIICSFESADICICRNGKKSFIICTPVHRVQNSKSRRTRACTRIALTCRQAWHLGRQLDMGIRPRDTATDRLLCSGFGGKVGRRNDPVSRSDDAKRYTSGEVSGRKLELHFGAQDLCKTLFFSSPNLGLKTEGARRVGA